MLDANTTFSIEAKLLKRALLWGEVAALLGAIVFGILWLTHPTANWEPAFGLCTLVSLGTEVARRLTQKNRANRFATDGIRIQHREKLRKTFQEELYECRAKRLRHDVIVRHVDRVDKYPNIDEKDRGISPWFRVDFLDTYDKGITLCIAIQGLNKCGEGYRRTNSRSGESADYNALLMADIPYDSIEAVNIEGDEYYSFPHIYCYFDFNGEPYERKWFAEQINQSHGHPYFRELCSYESVYRKTK